eukprot:1162730-Rhodomonas_salina.1
MGIKGYLNEKSVLEIFAFRPRQSSHSGGTHGSTPNSRELSKHYHVSNKTIREIWNRNSWAKLTDAAFAAASSSDIAQDSQGIDIDAFCGISSSDTSQGSPGYEAFSQASSSHTFQGLQDSNSVCEASSSNVSPGLQEIVEGIPIATIAEKLSFISHPDVDADMFPDFSPEKFPATFSFLDFISETLPADCSSSWNFSLSHSSQAASLEDRQMMSSSHSEDPFHGDWQSMLKYVDSRNTVPSGRFSSTENFALLHAHSIGLKPKRFADRF